MPKGTCIVNLTEVNKPPVADAGFDQNVLASEIVVLNGLGSEDPDGDHLDYTWRQIPGPSVDLSDPTAPQPVFSAPDVGAEGKSLFFELTVTDAGGLRSRDRCVVNVIGENDAPLANAGLGREAKPGGMVSLDGSNSKAMALE